MNDFLHMGGYAAYVWSAFGLTFIVLLGNLVFSLRGLKAARNRLRNRNMAEQGK